MSAGASEAGEGAGVSAGNKRAWLVGLLLLTVLAGLRIQGLGVDPPGQLVRGYRSQAHFRDEAAKAHEARNKAIFGRWQVSELDQYGFWRAQSPAWVWGEMLWFRAFGVGLIQARSFVVIHALIALALLYWLALVRHGLPTALVATALLGLNWSFLIYSRLALMEVPLICWLLVASTGLSQVERRPEQTGRWTALAVAGMIVACLIKQTALLLVPAFFIALPWLAARAGARLRGPDDGSAPRWTRLRARLALPQARVALLGLAVLAGLLAIFLLDPTYQHRLRFNAEHFTGTTGRSRTIVDGATLSLVTAPLSRRLLLMFKGFAPLILWLATLEFARLLWLRWRRRRAARRDEPEPTAAVPLEGRADVLDWWMLAWALLAFVANLATPHRAIRFQLILLPPAAWLAAVLALRAFTHSWPREWQARVVRAGLAILAIGALAITGHRYQRWQRNAERSAVEVSAELEQLIGDREAVVIGEFAAQAVLATGYKHFYVRPHQFNHRAETLEGLGITHVVFEPSDFVERHLTKAAPELLAGRRLLGTVYFRGRELEVWELAEPAPEPESAEGRTR